MVTYVMSGWNEHEDIMALVEDPSKKKSKLQSWSPRIKTFYKNMGNSPVWNPFYDKIQFSKASGKAKHDLLLVAGHHFSSFWKT